MPVSWAAQRRPWCSTFLKYQATAVPILGSWRIPTSKEKTTERGWSAASTGGRDKLIGINCNQTPINWNCKRCLYLELQFLRIATPRIAILWHLLLFCKKIVHWTCDPEPQNLSQVGWVHLYKAATVSLSTAYQRAQTLYICLIWMVEGVLGGCQPQPWRNGIISAQHVTQNPKIWAK